MPSSPVYVVSDIHLGAVPASTERAFRAFLGHVAHSASALLINGDLFDFWFEYRSVIHREHFRVLGKLADVVEAGVPVTFIGGNHDAWAGSFLRDEVGLELRNGPVRMDLAGRSALVAHGDGVGSGDLKYRALKAVIRHPLASAGFRAIHPDLGKRIANLASSTDEKLEMPEAAILGRSRYIQQWAEARLREDRELEMVITGHAHRPAIEEVMPGRYYLNSGDWIRSFTYLVLPPEGPPELRVWPAG